MTRTRVIELLTRRRAFLVARTRARERAGEFSPAFDYDAAEASALETAIRDVTWARSADLDGRR